MTKIIITGGLGFWGSVFCEHVHRKTDWDIIVLDKMTYASKGLERLRDNSLISSPRVKIFTCDLASPISEGLAQEIGNDIKYVVHAAAETHVDNSIKFPVQCIQNNVMSTVYILEFCRTLKNLEKFLYFSTDEVFSVPIDGVPFREDARHFPTNPYSSSKSASEMICISYRNTYGINIMITNCMNIFGEKQFVEKYVPKCIKYILEGKVLPIHTDENNKPGSRGYIHARSVSAAVLFLLDKGKVGERYNIVGEKQVDNLEMAEMIAKIMDKKLFYEFDRDIVTRFGHDISYLLDGSRMKEMGWKIPVPFEESLRRTVEWTLAHPKWLEE